jgi:hypothetical protein
MAKRQRPAAVTVLAILFLVFGSLGLVSSLCGCLSLGITQASISDRKLASQVRGPFDPPPAPDLNDYYLQHVPVYLPYQVLTTFLSAIGSGVLLVGGMGLLGLRPWARWLALGYAGYTVVFTLLTVTYQLVFILRANAGFLEEAHRWQATYRPPGRGFVYVVNDTWAYWGIPLNLGLAVAALAFAGLIVLVLLPRSAALAFSGRGASTSRGP